MESDLRKCRACGELKTRILSGKYGQHTKKFVDERGVAWCGNYCPDCNRTRVKALMTSKRLKEKQVNE